jgi:hypothetical protein
LNEEPSTAKLNISNAHHKHEIKEKQESSETRIPETKDSEKAAEEQDRTTGSPSSKPSERMTARSCGCTAGRPQSRRPTPLPAPHGGGYDAAWDQKPTPDRSAPPLGEFVAPFLRRAYPASDVQPATTTIVTTVAVLLRPVTSPG